MVRGLRPDACAPAAKPSVAPPLKTLSKGFNWKGDAVWECYMERKVPVRVAVSAIVLVFWLGEAVYAYLSYLRK